MNISSIVVKTTPRHLEEVRTSLESSGLCEYHFSDEKGNIIVTIEGSGVEEEIEKLKAIQELAHIISAEMIYTYSEDELEAAMERLVEGEVVPKVLEDEGMSAQGISYGGDVRNYVDTRSEATKKSRKE